jgi:iron complex outermembrane receptor protein
MTNYRMGRVVALGLSFSGGIFAQVGIAQQSHSDAPQLEEIIVTAEKRESTVQTTPISLTAVSGQDIRDRGLTDL